MNTFARTFIATPLALGLTSLIVACGAAVGEDDGSDPSVGNVEEVVKSQGSALTGPGDGILCPTFIQLSDGTQASPVTALLTETKAICRVLNPERVYTNSVGIDSGANGGLLGEFISDTLRYRISTSGATLKVKVYAAGIVVKTHDIYTCPSNGGSGQASSASWHGRTYQLGNPQVHYDGPSGKVRLAEAFSGRMRCSWRPSNVAVDFPRQTRPDNRDIAVNLDNTGFYRVYHMHNDLWERICQKDCQEKLTCAPGPHGCFGLGDAIEQCVDTCIADGW